MQSAGYERLCLCQVICSEEDKKWFAEAMQAQTVDVIKRMKEISMVMNMPTEVLQSQGVSIEELQGEVVELNLCTLVRV